MTDRITITVQLNDRTYKRTVNITTEFGCYIEINGQVNRIINRDFPFGKFFIISSFWQYAA